MWILSVPVLPNCAVLLFNSTYSTCNKSFSKRYKTNFFDILDQATAKLVAVCLEVFSHHNIFASINVSSKNLFPNFNARTCCWCKYETQC